MEVIPKEACLEEKDEVENLCLICCEKPSNIETLPCKHNVICYSCYRRSGSNSKCLRCVRRIQSIKPKCFYSQPLLEKLCERCGKEPAAISTPCQHQKYCATCIFDFIARYADDDPCPQCSKSISAIYTADMQWFQIT